MEAAKESETAQGISELEKTLRSGQTEMTLGQKNPTRPERFHGAGTELRLVDKAKNAGPGAAARDEMIKTEDKNKFERLVGENRQLDHRVGPGRMAQTLAKDVDKPVGVENAKNGQGRKMGVRYPTKKPRGTQ